jgi:polyisoprenoid-binding protein YceI
MPRFEPISSRSEFSLEAESSLHPIRASTNELTGFFEAKLLDNGRLDLTVPPKGRLEVYIESLQSGNKLIDLETQRRLNVRRFPTIIAEVVELRAADRDGNYRAAGNVTFHGETRRLENALVVKSIDERTIEVGGEITIDVRNYGIEPPKMLMLKVEPEVKATLKVVAQRVD